MKFTAHLITNEIVFLDEFVNTFVRSSFLELKKKLSDIIYTRYLWND